MSKNYYTNNLYNLYRFQDLVLKLIMKVDDTFYLTGGTALGRHYLEHRYSDGLDLFVNRENNFKQLSKLSFHNLLKCQIFSCSLATESCELTHFG